MRDERRDTWRDLEPLPREQIPERPERLSQTFLQTFQRCHRSGMLYIRYDGGAASHELIRGSLFHEAVEAMTLEMLAADEPRMPPEHAKSMMLETIRAHPEWAVPSGERDALRLMAWNWAEETVLDPAAVLGVEKKLTLELPRVGVTITGTVDLAQVVNPLCLGIDDYKTSLAQPTQEDYELSFQGPLYAVLLADGRDEAGLQLGKGARYFQLRELYPRYVRKQGGLAGPEPLILDRERILDKREEIEGLVEQVLYAWETGRFNATPGSWCGKCAARVECPLPKTLRPRSHIQTRDDAERAAAWLVRMSGYNDAGSGGAVRLVREGLRDYVGSEGPVRAGDIEFRFEAVERKTTDYEGMVAQAERAARFGEPFDPEDFIRRRQGTSFKKVKVNDESEAA